jgi:hypothetical protein
MDEWSWPSWGWRARLGYVVRAVRATLEREPRLVQIEASALDELAPPDSAMAAAALQLVTEVSEPWLLQHTLRTWVWGALLAKRDGTRVEPELLYAGALMHDLGLTERFRGPDGECFAVSGARAAARFAGERGASPERARRLADAIALHLEVVVPLSRSVEGHYLQAGAALDVLGRSRGAFAPALRQRVLHDHPPLDMVERMPDALEAEARRSPGTRMGWLCRGFSFPQRVRDAAWPR